MTSLHLLSFERCTNEFSQATESSQSHPGSTSTTTTITLAFHQQQQQQLALDPSSPAPGPNRHPNLARRDLPPRPTPTPIAITLSGGAAPLTLNPAGSVYVVNGNPSATLAPGPNGSATTLTLPGGTVLAMMKSDELADDDDAGPYLVVAQAPGGAQAVATVPPPPAPIPSSGGGGPGGRGGGGGGPGGGGRGDGPSPAEQSAAAAAASAAVVTVGALELSPAGGSGAYNVLKSVSGGGVGVAATLAPGGSVTVDGVVVALRTDGPSGQTVVVTGKAGDGGGATAPAATVTATERAPAGSGGAGDNPPVAVGNLTFLPAGSAYWIAEGTRTWTVMTGASVTVGGTVVGLTTDAGGRTVVVENAGNQTATAPASTVATLGPGGSGGTPVGQGPGSQGGGGGGGPLRTSDRMGAPVATNGVPTSAGASHGIRNLWSNEALWIGWIVGLLLFINI